MNKVLEYATLVYVYSHNQVNFFCKSPWASNIYFTIVKMWVEIIKN